MGVLFQSFVIGFPMEQQPGQQTRVSSEPEMPVKVPYNNAPNESVIHP